MDIKLGNNELGWENGDLKLVDGLERIKQQIIVALFTLLGDWLLDYRKGIDFTRGIREESFLKNDVKKQILGVLGVLQIKSLVLKREGLVVNIEATISTIYGRLEISEVFNQ